MEEIDNTVLLCGECSNKRKKDFQEKFDKYSLEVGDIIKAVFKEKGEASEHMWVEITSLSQNGIVGRLDNIPMGLKKIQLHDIVEVKLNKISDFVKGEV